jgi:DNA-binding CsgD family transcriptional regulator
MGGLVGRERELAVIRAFSDGIPAGGGTMLLSGEAGIGRSALLHAAAAVGARAGLRVLRASGSESGTAPFAGLNELLLPLRPDCGRLAGPERVALDVALGYCPGPAGDELMVGNAVLALLGQAAAGQPLLLLVDDLQWLDAASARLLEFAGRRLAGRRAGLLAAGRTGRGRLPDLGVADHEVPPLDDDPSAGLVAGRWPDLAPGVRQRIMAEARGNPLALLELPAGLTGAQRTGEERLPAALPLTRRLRGIFTPQIAALPAGPRRLLLLAALADRADLSLLRAALDDLAPAEQAGLVRVDEATRQLLFTHPLIRPTVLELSSAGDVRRGRLALARRLGGQPEQRAWQLAGAVSGPDQGVADLLEHVARQLLRDGAASRGVAALRRAAELSPRARDRGRRLAEAACLSATLTGELTAVPRLLAGARRAGREQGGAPEPAAALAATVAEACLLRHDAEDIGAIHRLLASAVLSPAGHDALTGALHALLEVCADGGRPQLWAPFDAALAGLPPGSRAGLDLLASTQADPARSALGALGRLDTALAGLSHESSDQRVLVLSAAAARTDRLAGCRTALRRVAGHGREGGAIVPVIGALTLLCLDSFLSGSWDEACRLGAECLQMCQSSGQPGLAWPAREHLAMIAAARGDDELVRELTGELLRWALPRRLTLARMAVHRVSSLAALGRADMAEAYREAAAISPPGILASHTPHALWAVLDLVEAAVRTGRGREAGAHVAAARAAGIAGISPRLALLVTTSAALTAPAGAAGPLFEQALDLPDADRFPFELARVQLAYGEHLRRAGAPGEARAHLSAGRAVFDALGARPWAGRAASELRAARLIPARPEDHQFSALTCQEHRIVALAAAGLTNKQIGQRLYLSPRTVGSHLYRAFPKLGVSSRAGLRDALTARGSGTIPLCRSPSPSCCAACAPGPS